MQQLSLKKGVLMYYCLDKYSIRIKSVCKNTGSIAAVTWGWSKKLYMFILLSHDARVFQPLIWAFCIRFMVQISSLNQCSATFVRLRHTKLKLWFLLAHRQYYKNFVILHCNDNLCKNVIYLLHIVPKYAYIIHILLLLNFSSHMQLYDNIHMQHECKVSKFEAKYSVWTIF
jgi:hypothetical protein